MLKKLISVIFDRKGVLKKQKTASVEIRISFNRTCRKYIQFTKCTQAEWATVQHSKELNDEVARLEGIAQAMIILKEDLTIENLDKHLGLECKVLGPRKDKEDRDELTEEMQEEIELQKLLASPTSFLDFFTSQYKKKEYTKSGIKWKEVVLASLKEFKKIKKFEDLTPRNIMKYDAWLDNGNRMRTTIHNYHKHVHMYALKAWKQGYIPFDPYSKCDIENGCSKERKPLSEDELLKILHHNFTGTTEKVRDLFIFSAYTGLAYCDVMLFRYSKMTETYNNQVYIDGQRLKTGSDFYTPILPHAMEVLKKYHYQLPYYTDQSINRHLKIIKEECNIRKPMTFHIARHSFATLCLSYDIPYEQLRKMMGHKSIKTTQIYGKVLRVSVVKHTEKMIAQIR